MLYYAFNIQSTPNVMQMHSTLISVHCRFVIAQRECNRARNLHVNYLEYSPYCAIDHIYTVQHIYAYIPHSRFDAFISTQTHFAHNLR